MRTPCAKSFLVFGRVPRRLPAPTYWPWASEYPLTPSNTRSNS